MENNLNKNNLNKNNTELLANENSPKNIQILTMIINNNIYNFNDLNLNNILLPFLLHTNKQNYYNTQKNAFIFPEAIDLDSLHLFCNFLLTPEKVDITKFNQLKKLLNICVFFNAIEIINNISKKYIEPKLNRDSCLDIIIYFLDFIYTENESIKNIFRKVIKEAIILISKNLIYFINNKQTELYSLNCETLEEIIELYLKDIDNKKISNEDIKNVFELLIYSRGISNDIFLLLENERKKAINNFESLFKEKKNITPTYIWKFTYDDIKKQNYKETTIYLDNLNILLISYYDNINDIFQLAIQILGIKRKDENNESDTSTAKKIINDEDISLSQEMYSEKKNALINILSLCEISEINYKSHINFNGIYIKNNSRFLVCKIDNFIKKFKNEKKGEFSLKLYFSRNYIFPKIIEYICQNFHKYYNYSSINKLPRSAMNILLKNEKIANEPNKENYKLYSIENWIKFKGDNINKKHMDIFKNIDWKKIDNDKLIDFFMQNAKLISKDELLKNDLFFEIQRRFQEEYSSYFLNNKTFMNNSKSISISNYEYNQEKNEYLYFTFDFLTKILSYLISNNTFNSNKKNIYEISDNSTNGDNSKDNAYMFKEEKDINFPITQRNNIPKNKISKNINNSPFLNNNKKKNHLKNNSEDINKNNNKMINKSNIYNKKNNSNIQSNRGDKKSSNNSISSYQINLSGASGADSLNSGCGNISLFNKQNNKQNDKISIVNKGIKSFTPNNSKGKVITKNKMNINYNNKYNKTISSKPLRIQYKKMHSKSVDKGILLSEDKKNIPIDLSDKRVGLFPNYLNNVQNAKDNLNDMKNYKNITQIKKRLSNKDNNTNKIPIQYYNVNNTKNDKTSLIIGINDGNISNKSGSKTKNKMK